MSKKFSLDFKGFAEYAERLEQLGASLKDTAEEALTKSKELVNDQLHAEMAKHRRTDRTESSILDNAQVVWSGGEASIDVGFDIAHGGLPSIFLMYGTPKMAADRNLYDAVYGNAMKKRIRKLQEEIFAQAIEKAMGA